MIISKNFTLEELIYSNRAIEEGIDNTPSPDQKSNIVSLVLNILQPARDALDFAIIISSGFRCELVNKLLGGSKTSDHVNGCAADIKLSNGDNATLFNWLRDNVSFDQLIWEFGDDNQPKWVHVSYRTKRSNRNQVLRAIKENGKTKYIKL